MFDRLMRKNWPQKIGPGLDTSKSGFAKPGMCNSSNFDCLSHPSNEESFH